MASRYDFREMVRSRQRQSEEVPPAPDPLGEAQRLETRSG